MGMYNIHYSSHTIPMFLKVSTYVEVHFSFIYECISKGDQTNYHFGTISGKVKNKIHEIHNEYDAQKYKTVQ